MHSRKATTIPEKKQMSTLTSSVTGFLTYKLRLSLSTPLSSLPKKMCSLNLIKKNLNHLRLKNQKKNDS